MYRAIFIFRGNPVNIEGKQIRKEGELNVHNNTEQYATVLCANHDFNDRTVFFYNDMDDGDDRRRCRFRVRTSCGEKLFRVDRRHRLGCGKGQETVLRKPRACFGKADLCATSVLRRRTAQQSVFVRLSLRTLMS